MRDGTVDVDALVRLFGDEFGFKIEPGRETVEVILRGETVIRLPMSGPMYPKDTVEVKLAERIWKFTVPRWSLTLSP